MQKLPAELYYTFRSSTILYQTSYIGHLIYFDVRCPMYDLRYLIFVPDHKAQSRRELFLSEAQFFKVEYNCPELIHGEAYLNPMAAPSK